MRKRIEITPGVIAELHMLTRVELDDEETTLGDFMPMVEQRLYGVEITDAVSKTNYTTTARTNREVGPFTAYMIAEILQCCKELKDERDLALMLLKAVTHDERITKEVSSQTLLSMINERHK